jgi:H+-transporting ATPase
MWTSRPGGWLLLSSLLDLGIATSLAISGTLMAPLSASTVGAVFAGTIAFSLALDAVKHVTFKRLNIV